MWQAYWPASTAYGSRRLLCARCRPSSLPAMPFALDPLGRWTDTVHRQSDHPFFLLLIGWNIYILMLLFYSFMFNIRMPKVRPIRRASLWVAAAIQAAVPSPPPRSSPRIAALQDVPSSPAYSPYRASPPVATSELATSSPIRKPAKKKNPKRLVLKFISLQEFVYSKPQPNISSRDKEGRYRVVALNRQIYATSFSNLIISDDFAVINLLMS